MHVYCGVASRALTHSGMINYVNDSDESSSCLLLRQRILSQKTRIFDV